MNKWTKQASGPTPAGPDVCRIVENRHRSVVAVNVPEGPADYLVKEHNEAVEEATADNPTMWQRYRLAALQGLCANPKESFDDLGDIEERATILADYMIGVK